MNTNPKSWSVGIYFIAVVGTFFIMAWLVSFVRQYTQPPPLNQARAEERRKALADLEAANANALNNYAWLDQSKGLVQLPVQVAMQLTIQEWQKPAQARAKLVNLANQVSASAPAPATNAPPAAAPAAPAKSP